MGESLILTSRPTLSDVARMANVSVATASRALSNPDLVAEGTRKAVRDAAEACGYQINLVARSLRMQKTETILALLPEIDNRFYPAIIEGMEKSAHAAGYSMILGLSPHAPKRDGHYFEIVNSRRVDGLIVLHSDIGQAGSKQVAFSIPVVKVLESLPGDGSLSVRVNEVALVELAVRHLASLGHRRIAHISGSEHSIVARERIRGFRLAAAVAGCDSDNDLVLQGDFSFESGVHAMQTLLRRPKFPTAVFCANDSSALGAIKACRQFGLSIPGDISVASIDDIDDAQQALPPLTTIRQPRHDIGMEAVNLLIAHIEGRNLPVREIVMPVELIVRESTAAPRRAG
jgi:LacI family transcriptional regulator, repressor for deo operon, udp, cdd, tsx, nupC, and nupG